MKQQINLCTAKGKTITDIVYAFTGTQLVITFTDNTYSVLDIDEGYPEESVSISISAGLEPDDFGHGNLIETGIYTEAELRKMQEDEVNRKKDAELCERTRLNNKYGQP